MYIQSNNCFLLGIQKAQALNFLSITLHLHHSLILQCDCMLSQWNAHYRNSVSQISFCASKIIIARRHQKKSLNIWSLLKQLLLWLKANRKFLCPEHKGAFWSYVSWWYQCMHLCISTWAKHEARLNVCSEKKNMYYYCSFFRNGC